ncbi:MAG: TonB-dependent hemoglobin/transferrin/lactoferrin family receptor, partial [Gammaproteobacteria bacterium]|nr:TonB-dependent hemoglobin/transferrin/lactoferrin family receptor [Gammaproteobacteria bacterium]
ATKSPRPVADVAGSVALIESAELADRLGIDIADLVRYLPGVSIPRAGTRFGWDSYNIRGVGGNRVAIELDGIPVANHFEIGSYSNAGRDVIDVGLLRRVEVLYGPASTLYGSDAIGGVVSYQTYDPDDLAQTGEPYLSVTTGYRDDQESYDARLTSAWASENTGVLLSVGRRTGEQRDASALGGAPEDWQDWDTANAFGKFTWDLNQTDRLTATLETHRQEGDTNVRSILGTGRFRSTTLLTGDDTQDRDRLSVAYDFGARNIDGHLIAYHHATETDQFSVEERAGSDLRRERQFDFEQETTGLEFNATTAIRRGSTTHNLGYGIELARTRTTESRDAWQTNLAGDDFTNIVLGETFPVRDFPVSRDVEIGIYVQDEISLGSLTLIPALRFDDYRLDPRPDTVYLEDNPDSDIVSIDESRLSPRFGVIYALNDGWSAFGQYAQGFRAPPFEDANIGLDIPLFNIRALPNPDLRSETSDGLELGVRRYAANSEFSVAAHYTEYDDFIASRARLGADPVSGVLLFQSRNLDKAKIYGAELRYRQQLNDNVGLRLALAWARGEDDVTGAPIDTIDPIEMVFGLDWQSKRLPLTTQLTWTLVDQQDRINDPDDELAGTAGFGSVDVTARYTVANATLRAGVFNVFDKAHWRWSSVRGLAADDPTRPLLSEPGRHAGISLFLQW